MILSAGLWATLLATAAMPTAPAAAAPGPVACSATDRSPARADALTRADLATLAACAGQGDAVARNELGRRHGLGLGIAVDSRRSFEAYRIAAEAGYPQAQANLGYMYFKGEGVARDTALAYQWMEKAALAGSAQAQHGLGYMHATGDGARRDGALAERWFLAAAEQGYVQAQQALVTLYSDGQLMRPRPDEAVVWLHRARDAVLHGQAWRKEDGE